MTTSQVAEEVSLPNYHAYLIRIWRDSEQAPWRASVTFVATGEVHRFASPQSAWAHIQVRMEAQTQADPGIGQQ